LGIKISIAAAKKDFLTLLKRAHQEPVIITRRNKPEAVIPPFAEYERLQRMMAYASMVCISHELKEVGVSATELYEASRSELEERP